MRKFLLVIFINLVLISCQSDGYNPVMQTERAKPVPVDQGGLYGGTWTGEAISVPYTETCGGAELTIEIKNSRLKGNGSDLQGSSLRFDGFISEKETIYMKSTSAYIGNLKITGKLTSMQVAKGSWKGDKGCNGTWILTKEK
jgi:hypothetical protein